jgi:hypothetical protein
MRSLAIDRNGTAYVVSGGQIRRFDAANGDELEPIEYSQGTGFDNVEVEADGSLVAFWRGMRKSAAGRLEGIGEEIVRFDRHGDVKMRLLDPISSRSESPGVTIELAVDGEGDIYVLDRISSAVFAFDRDGEFRTRFGSRGKEPGQFTAPSDIVVDGIGRILVSDFSRIQVFDRTGRFLESFTYRGAASGLAVDDQDHLYIAARDHVDVLTID